MSLCARCGATFICGMADRVSTEPCWCTRLPALPAAALPLSNTALPLSITASPLATDGAASSLDGGAACLCPACLRRETGSPAGEA
jgi:hypothetical protein